MAKPQPSYYVVTTEGRWDKLHDSLALADQLPDYSAYITPPSPKNGGWRCVYPGAAGEVGWKSKGRGLCRSASRALDGLL